MDLKIIRAILMRASRIMKLVVNPKITKEDLMQIRINCMAIVEHIDNAEKKG